jgi:hypothetical protein
MTLLKLTKVNLMNFGFYTQHPCFFLPSFGSQEAVG